LEATAAGDRRIDDLLTVLEVTRRLAATSELQPLLEAVEQSARKVLDCERASLFLHDPATDELISRVATGTGGGGVRFPAGAGIAGSAFRSGSTINVPDAYADPRFNPEVDRRTGYRTRSMLTCPLRGWEGEIVGVLQVLNKSGGPFDAWDEVLAGALGAQAGVAVQRQLLLDEYAKKRRFERDLDLARAIQQALLPRKAPTVPGFDVAGWNRPADETGGDYFDFQTTAGGSLALTVADVSGHGIGPALVVAECRALFRAALAQTADPEQVVVRVNDVLCDDLADGRFVTAFLGVLDPAAARLDYVSAGHGPVYHYRAAADAFDELPPQGCPLGILPGDAFAPAGRVDLAPGDFVAVLTDGFFEWCDPSETCFGVDRLRDQLRADRHRDGAAMIASLVGAVTSFAAGAPQRDDLTAVVVKRSEGRFEDQGNRIS